MCKTFGTHELIPLTRRPMAGWLYEGGDSTRLITDDGSCYNDSIGPAQDDILSDNSCHFVSFAKEK